jgi:hypothetical protein
MESHADLAAPGPPQLRVPLVVFKFPGSPDLAQPEELATLLSTTGDPLIQVVTGGAALKKATPFADWSAVGDQLFLPYSWVELWSLSSARPDDGVLEMDDALRLSILPEKASLIMDALLSVGGLALSECADAGDFSLRVAAAAAACAMDDRLRLTSADTCQAQPRKDEDTNLTARKRAARDWFYVVTVESLCEQGSLGALAILQFAVRPRFKAKDRDLFGSTFERLLTSLVHITASRSAVYATAVEEVTAGNASSVADYVAETWKLILHEARAHGLKLPARASRRLIEIELWARTVFGSEEQKKSAFMEMFQAVMLPKLPCVALLLDPRAGSLVELLGQFEQVAGLLMPGVGWANWPCAEAVDLELRPVKALLESMQAQGLPAKERVANLRLHLRSTRFLSNSMSSQGQLKGTSGLDGAGGDLSSGSIGNSGLVAMRSASFLSTESKVALIIADKEPDIVQLFDALLGSESKIFYMVGVGALKKQTHNRVVESCSPLIPSFCYYWTAFLSQNEDGSPNLEAYGHPMQSEDVDHLLKGHFHLVNWIRVAQSIDLWCHGVHPDVDASYGDYETLVDVQRVVGKTLRLLRIEDEMASGAGSFTHIMGRILKMHRRAGALPAEGGARADHHANVQKTLKDALEEGGDRWARQWRAPVDYSTPLYHTFLTPAAYNIHGLDDVEEMSEQIFKMKKVLPSMFGGSWAANMSPAFSNSDLMNPSRGDYSRLAP